MQNKTIDYSQIPETTRKQAEEKIAALARQAREGGEAQQKLTKKAAEYLQKAFNNPDFVIYNGQSLKIREFAELLSRTARTAAVTEDVLRQCREYNTDLVEVSHHNTTCEICKRYQGKVFSISGKHPKYPKLEEKPPYHQACEHFISPTSEIALKYRDWKPNETDEQYTKRHSEEDK
jgi:hypothetical protein